MTIRIVNPHPLYRASGLGPYLRCIILALLPIAIVWPLSRLGVFSNGQAADFLVRVNFAGMVIGAFVLMNAIYRRALKYRDHFYVLADSDENRRIVDESYDWMFSDSVQQRCFCASVALLATATGVTLGVPFQGTAFWYIVAYSLVVGYIVGWGVWFTVTLMVFVYRLTSRRGLRVAAVNSSDSLGLFELAQLSSDWSVFLFIEAALVYAGLVLPPWHADKSIVVGVQLFWLAVLMALMVFNFLFPLTRCRDVILGAKRKALLQVQELLEASWANYVDAKCAGPDTVRAHVDFLTNQQHLIRARGQIVLDASIVVRFWSTVIAPAVPVGVHLLQSGRWPF